MNEKRIGIMGGTFDPIHLGHLIIAEASRMMFHLDEILFVPVGDPPHKDKKKVSSAEHRLKMIELSIADNPAFFVSDMEIRRQGETYTIDTLKELHDRYPENKMFFITGADAMDSITSWKDYEKLFSYADFVVAIRGEEARYQLKGEIAKFREHILRLDTPFVDISSTKIRQCVRDDISIRYVVREDVRVYIDEKGLYKAR